MVSVEENSFTRHFFASQLISGGVAGFLVDCILFPIDTLKTRLQSEKGFRRSGAFTNVYKGLAPVAAGSAPTAALFFTTYETSKKLLSPYVPQKHNYMVHMAAASIGETVACLIRVPVEIVKQRRQALSQNADAPFFRLIWAAYKSEGLVKGVYRGFSTTLAREIPFSFIQFPLWELFKSKWTHITGLPLTSASSAVCGAFAGGIAAAITTPLDVAKTRIMLAERANGSNIRLVPVLVQIRQTKGIKGLFAGIVPRVTWIFIGGGIFFGFYESTNSLFRNDSFLM